MMCNDCLDGEMFDVVRACYPYDGEEEIDEGYTAIECSFDGEYVICEGDMTVMDGEYGCQSVSYGDWYPYPDGEFYCFWVFGM